MLSQLDTTKSAITSLLSATIGTVSNYLTIPSLMGILTVDVALQRLAWTVAVLAGLVAIVNGTKSWLVKKVKTKKEDESDTDKTNR